MGRPAIMDLNLFNFDLCLEQDGKCKSRKRAMYELKKKKCLNIKYIIFMIKNLLGIPDDVYRKTKVRIIQAEVIKRRGTHSDAHLHGVSYFDAKSNAHRVILERNLPSIVSYCTMIHEMVHVFVGAMARTASVTLNETAKFWEEHLCFFISLLLANQLLQKNRYANMPHVHFDLATYKDIYLKNPNNQKPYIILQQLARERGLKFVFNILFQLK